MLNVFEQKPYPWRRRARRHFFRHLPNLWRGLALNPYFQSTTLNQDQAAFERAHFFANGDDAIPGGFPTATVWSANDDATVEHLKAARPDLIMVYGTGLLRRHIFELAPLGAINAHGGLLPGYRGLDTNLWAALEGKPEDMAVTIHKIDPELDTGPVYLTRRLGPVPGLDLASFRYHSAILSTDLLLEVLTGFAGGTAEATAQSSRGRYFGPMPVRLKRRAERIIREWTLQALPAEREAA